MSTEPIPHIRRPVHLKSQMRLHRALARKGDSPLVREEPVIAATQHATIFRDGMPHDMPQMAQALRDKPDSACERIVLPVEDVRILGHTATRSSVALILTDNGTLQNEFEYFRQTVGSEQSAYLPHVTVLRATSADINSETAREAMQHIKESVLARAPSEVTLEPLNIRYSADVTTSRIPIAN